MARPSCLHTNWCALHLKSGLDFLMIGGGGLLRCDPHAWLAHLLGNFDSNYVHVLQDVERSVAFERSCRVNKASVRHMLWLAVNFFGLGTLSIRYACCDCLDTVHDGNACAGC